MEDLGTSVLGSTPDGTPQGAFVESLVRNNKKIRQDRAQQIALTTETLIKRRVEDLGTKIQQMKWDREGLLDLSPTSADSLVLASDFKAQEFVDKYINIGLNIRNAEIELEICKAAYKYLFNK